MDSLRRAFLLGAAGAAAGLAGCLGGGGDGSATASIEPWSLPDHPALAGTEAQPFVGRPPGEARGLIVAFEDPSCPSCGHFERNVFPTLMDDLFDTGKVTFVFRGIPVVYPWGAPATRALEATYAQDANSFWQLKEHYYANQDAFTPENVYPRTEEFLAASTSVDAARVVREARTQVYDDAIRRDLQAAQDAGVRGTPTFYLFADGEFRTTVVGPQDASVFRNALGV